MYVATWVLIKETNCCMDIGMVVFLQ